MVCSATLSSHSSFHLPVKGDKHKGGEDGMQENNQIAHTWEPEASGENHSFLSKSNGLPMCIYLYGIRETSLPVLIGLPQISFSREFPEAFVPAAEVLL